MANFGITKDFRLPIIPIGAGPFTPPNENQGGSSSVNGDNNGLSVGGDQNSWNVGGDTWNLDQSNPTNNYNYSNVFEGDTYLTNQLTNNINNYINNVIKNTIINNIKKGVTLEEVKALFAQC